MELDWLTAPDEEVAAAMAAQQREQRPQWVPPRRRVLLHVNQSLILWYLCVVLLVFGVRVDSYQDGHLTASDLPGLVVAAAVLALWLAGTVWLHRWAARPPSPRSRLRMWRRDLTALANGFEPAPRPVATFSSLLAREGASAREHPRFVAPGVEFGNLTPRGRRAVEWHYLRVALPAPLPHLVLDATANDGIRSDLPAGIERDQRLSLEGGFDRHFTVYSPVSYRSDALYVLTPDVMADLVDHARGYDVEIVDDSVVFFTRPGADFGRPEPWMAVDRILSTVVPRLMAKTPRYLDARVPGQEEPRVLAAMRAEQEYPGVPYVATRPRIGPDGHRLDLRRRDSSALSLLGAVGWYALLTLLYAVPGIIAFAGFMSIVDGR